ncbi:GNAT family N-acetyltransferase [Tuwongella immobilis]|uniref:N-acetyltransferase domain-containing protein n=1 Tax=Tuwongella immobilis TaxID=692036 RepID=A0A6C2YTN7_9BACT|nr:GNAT family N-acetyltransferase [Tuwongella immobilis]VIP04784.1 n-terminal acetyltransferase : Acetyltransferase OS=Singulisphaera acidiphila (strain ATCC BAA-1392 / DSM 18658 / VKM B-2454 / MOB10) GN=Sinac_0822 PE=4 SV=1: Acetyltransf_1 [Tuwongella immobilis]VTS06927.1 n-terminal acetyltransferase : Acetyltransferase OS=Singulisphaera acidiphila (strain ATCC BAA-1392 / DSM 18658 / VKM B-2454 / MOB10) GN=Sinac_0822 PE=4 SV=1: Acetyltransf_1 [Tuwongella immobilis]
MTHTVYYKRFRMECSLEDIPAPDRLPDGFIWLPWNDSLLELHAETKLACFQHEVDSTVFPSLGELPGCLNLMKAIRNRPGFCPQATWLIAGPDGFCGTVQGLIDAAGLGAIQNLGVVPGCRGLGLGKALLLQALQGFRQVGLSRGFLEVTACNELAVQMYRRFGFRSVKTIYRSVECAVPLGVGSAT